jgi:branched-chain amino acid transport system substrate-binding protein
MKKFGLCPAAALLGGLVFAPILGLSSHPALAEVPGNVVRIGVLDDMSGPFADQGGAGAVAAARLAAEDFGPESGGLKVEILAADHQNKPDIGTAIARRWVDEQGVDAVVALPNSGVALAVAAVMAERHRAALASSALTSDLTGKSCQPTTVQWVSDTWAQGASTAHAMVARNLKTWYFLTVDYALGHTLERDATTTLVALGGKVLGSATAPLGTSDFSSPLLQAANSGAQVLALANTGADAINAIKQAAEFGLGAKGTQLAALFLQISDIHALGLKTAAGLQLVEAFYWDSNETTRAWSQRFAARMQGRMPTEDQAGVYSATLAYLRAVRAARSIEGEVVVRQMESAPIADPLFGPVTIRPDGRAVHAMYLFQVKTPAESHGEWDLYKLVATIPGESAFRPLAAGGCRLVAGR